jgi:DNA-binding CsgD family transcriptional regulator
MRQGPLTEYDIRRIFRTVVSIDARDAASLLEIVHNGALDDGIDPFPRRVLLDLAELIPSDACVGYQEAEVAGRFRVVEPVEVIGMPPSPTTEGAFHTLGWQNPMHCRLHAREHGVIRLSDLLTRRHRLRLEYNDVVWRAHGIDDALRIWLPAPPGRARSVYLERGRKNYTERERTLFTLLRPHLVRMGINAKSRRRFGNGRGLTPREAEVLGWVARGKSNIEIGAVLFISPLTVRKHLENIFEKLGVRTRTAAAAFAQTELRTEDWGSVWRRRGTHPDPSLPFEDS